MSFTKIKYKGKFSEQIIIVSFWILLFSSPLLFGSFENSIEWSKVFNAWKDQLFLLALFAINRFVLLPKLFFNNKRLLYIISVAGLIFLITTGAQLYRTKGFAKPMGFPPDQERVENRPFREPPAPNRRRGQNQPLPNQMPPIPLFANLLILSILVVGFDTGLSVSMKLGRTEQERVKLEKESVENQLAFLKNQVSPHFFMNTLNNIHALMDIDVDEAKESIIELSKLMRHLLYESEVGMNPIAKEVDFIKNYINLMKLRFSEKVKITLEIPEKPPKKSIPPLLFTSLVENAFKHGISYDKKSFVSIVLSFTNDKLLFKLRNSNHKQLSKDDMQGIGIENTIKRLDLIYKDKYSLAINDQDDEFIVSLSIPI